MKSREWRREGNTQEISLHTEVNSFHRQFYINAQILQYTLWCNFPFFCLSQVSVYSLISDLKKGATSRFSIPAWIIPWTEEPGGLQSTGSQRVGHDWATEDTQPSVSGIFRNSREDFPDGPVVKTAHFSCRGPMFDPWSGKLHMPQGTTKKINKNKDPYIF